MRTDATLGDQYEIDVCSQAIYYQCDRFREGEHSQYTDHKFAAGLALATST